MRSRTSFSERAHCLGHGFDREAIPLKRFNLGVEIGARLLQKHCGRNSQMLVEGARHRHCERALRIALDLLDLRWRVPILMLDFARPSQEWLHGVAGSLPELTKGLHDPKTN